MARKRSPPSDRGYRRLTTSQAEEVTFQIVQRESDLHITCQARAEIDVREVASSALRQARSTLQMAITLDPAFQTSLTPLKGPEQGSAFLKAMCAAAELCGVGPMATVAGHVAEHVATALLEAGCSSAVVENGGDIFVASPGPRMVGIMGNPSQGPTLCLALNPEDMPCSICSSSATIGHSLSFGKAELVAVRSPSGAMADAAATALANILHTPADIPAVLVQAQSWARLPPPLRLDGVFAICQGKLGIWGKMELAACE